MHTCPYTRKLNCPCDWLHSQEWGLEHLLVTSNSDFVIWKGSGLWLSFIFHSSACWPQSSLTSDFHEQHLVWWWRSSFTFIVDTTVVSLLERNYLNNFIFVPAYRPYLCFLIWSDRAHIIIFLVVRSHAQNHLRMPKINCACYLPHAQYFAHDKTWMWSNFSCVEEVMKDIPAFVTDSLENRLLQLATTATDVYRFYQKLMTTKLPRLHLNMLDCI